MISKGARGSMGVDEGSRKKEANKNKFDKQPVTPRGAQIGHKSLFGQNSPMLEANK